MSQQNSTIGDIVRKNEREYIRGSTTISKYVNHSMYDTISTISAYLHSTHTSGKFDSQGREKPFFNIVKAASNIWFRATDLDRRHIKIRATKSKDWIDSFLATVHVQAWMRKVRFASFLNEWGRVLSRYGSAVVKFIKKDGELVPRVIPWDTIIVDPVDFDANEKIEILQLTEAQLRKKESTAGWDGEQIEALINAVQSRETIDKKKKDNKSHYYKVYEVHGVLPRSLLMKEDDATEEDKKTFVQQMHVISYVGGKEKGRGRSKKEDFEDFTLFAGKEKKEMYMITHLIKEDGRTLSIGSVENLFDPQWIQNHSALAVKNHLDLASKLIFQTADPNFVGKNAFSSIEHGDILVHGMGDNMKLSKVDNSSHDTAQWGNYAIQWKQLGNEINGISEAMLGAAPKSGTAWRQTEALLQESHSMFELMTENKGLHLEDMFREYILPWIRDTKMDTADEVSATLEQYDIDRIDGMYIKNLSTKEVNRKIIDLVKNLKPGETVTEDDRQLMVAKTEDEIKESLTRLGKQRFFKPSEFGDKTWKAQFKDMPWELEIDITGEVRMMQEWLTTINTALKIVVDPNFQNNPQAQRIVGKVLEMTGAMSPLELEAMPKPTQRPELQPVIPPGGGGSSTDIEGVLENK